jgi:hypothetical protein
VRANAELLRVSAQHRGCRGPEASLTVARVVGSKLLVGHIGDTRACPLRYGRATLPLERAARAATDEDVAVVIGRVGGDGPSAQATGDGPGSPEVAALTDARTARPATSCPLSILDPFPGLSEALLEDLGGSREHALVRPGSPSRGRPARRGARRREGGGRRRDRRHARRAPDRLHGPRAGGSGEHPPGGGHHRVPRARTRRAPRAARTADLDRPNRILTSHFRPARDRTRGGDPRSLGSAARSDGGPVASGAGHRTARERRGHDATRREGAPTGTRRGPDGCGGGGRWNGRAGAPPASAGLHETVRGGGPLGSGCPGTSGTATRRSSSSSVPAARLP